jgi:hypothetical protein
MILALLAAAAQAGAVDAERAFADMAQKQGQWTAFRAYAAPDALMFVPAERNAQEWLKGRKDPAASVHWWPARSWVSCDGSVAVNIGPALYGISGFGSFTTVWKRQDDGGWKWLLDQGHQLPRALAAGETAKVSRASCAGRPTLVEAAPPAEPASGLLAQALEKASPDLIVLEEGQNPSGRPTKQPKLEFAPIASGASADRTLYWRANRIEGGAPGARALQIFLWDGKAYRLHLLDLHEGRAG